MIVDNNPSERKDNPIPWATIPWREIRDRLEIRSSDGLFCMSAREFVRQGKVSPPSKEFKRAFNILIYLCKAGPHVQAIVARRILEKAGFKKGKIPKEAYAKNRTDHDQLRLYQVNPASLIRAIDDVKRGIGSVVKGKLKDESARKEAFKRVFKRDMTPEEIEALRKKGGFERITELALFFWSCRIWVNYETLRDLYWSPETVSVKKELESLGDIYAISSSDKKWLSWGGHRGFIASDLESA